METTTALTLVIPNEYHNDINDIRKLYDRAYPRWMPHINFLFPFVAEDKFDDIINKLTPILQSFGSFELDLSEIGYFKQGKNVTMHIKPKDSTKLKQLFELIKKTLPDVPTKHDEFNAHLTIGQFKNSEVNVKVVEMTNWIKDKDFKCTVDHICILQRSKTDNNVPFSVNRKIMLV
jgi:2'-5' RNA ligase